MEYLAEYGLFLGKALTVVISIVAIILFSVSVAMKPKSKDGELTIDNLSTELKEVKQQVTEQFNAVSDKKSAKKKKKEKDTEDEEKPKLFVIDFTGGIDAKEVDNLREEVTAILAVATEKDEVLIRLDSGGGVVHGYGLGASQLQRIKDKGISLTVSVDKIAASGGYMMAVVADKIIAAPFAILGSIGVMAQLPNFNRLLKKHDVDYELFTAGEYKRTVTMFGENTEKGKEKFKEDLELTHVLFKEFILNYRPDVVIDDVATGEHWYANIAINKGLCDELQVSDDYLMSHFDTHDMLLVKYRTKPTFAEKLNMGLVNALYALWNRIQKDNQTRL